jgi:hypothetical protein
MFGIGEAVAAGLKVIEKFVPDPAAKAQAEIALRDALQGWDANQTRVNEAEAASGSLYVGGWRPAVGWCCALALFYTYLLVPIGMWAAFVVGKPIPKPPVLDANLWELMFGMLGMAGMRSYEKLRGVATK